MQADATSTIDTRPRRPTLAGKFAGGLQAAWPLFKLASSRGCAVLAQFAVQVVVGVLAGPAGLGILQLFFSWTCIAGEILALGLPAHALRRVSVAYADGERSSVQKLLRESRDKIFRASIVVGVPGYLLLTMLRPKDYSSEWALYPWLLTAVLITAPLFSLLRLYAESLKATGSALAAISVESLCSPVTLLLVCGYYWLSDQVVTVAMLVMAYGCSLAIAPLALLKLLQGQLVNCVQPAGRGSHKPGATPPQDLLYLWACGILSIVFLHLPFLVMPWFVDPSEIGVFAVANKLINLVTTLLLLLAAVYGPAFARSAAQQDNAGLLLLLRRTQLISSAIFLPASLALVFLAEPLGKLFGSGFSGLQTYLLILGAGHLFNAATGLSGVLLNMAGAAHKEMYTLATAIALALGVSLWVGRSYGPEELAMVFSGSIALKNIGSYFLARSMLNSLRNKP